MGSKEKIEEDKKKMLELLRKKSNMNMEELAKEIGCSRQTIWRMLKDLEEEIIKGYTIVTDDGKLGKRRFYVILKRKCVPFDNKFLNFLYRDMFLTKEATLSKVEIEDIVITKGNYDLVITILAKSVIAVDSFIESLSHLLHEYIDWIDVLDGIFTIQRNSKVIAKEKDVKKFFSYDIGEE